jgi:hypothetical protein
MKSAKAPLTSASSVRRARMDQFSKNGRAWQLLWSAGWSSITRIELRLLRRLAQSRRRASFLDGLSAGNKALLRDAPSKLCGHKARNTGASSQATPPEEEVGA